MVIANFIENNEKTSDIEEKLFNKLYQLGYSACSRYSTNKNTEFKNITDSVFDEMVENNIILMYSTDIGREAVINPTGSKYYVSIGSEDLSNKLMQVYGSQVLNIKITEDTKTKYDKSSSTLLLNMHLSIEKMLEKILEKVREKRGN